MHIWRWFHGLISLVYTNKPGKRRPGVPATRNERRGEWGECDADDEKNYEKQPICILWLGAAICGPSNERKFNSLSLRKAYNRRVPNVIERAGVSGVFRDRNHRINISSSRVSISHGYSVTMCKHGLDSGLTDWNLDWALEWHSNTEKCINEMHRGG